MEDNNIVVVGGGIAGISSALFYAKKGMNVTLVEKAKELGGLLKSQKLFKEDYIFDYGTHFLRETGNEEIDSLLFKYGNLKKFDYLKTGSYYKELYKKNGFLSTKYLPPSTEKEYLANLKKSKLKKKYKNLQEQLDAYFGKDFGKILAKISEKFFFTNASELAPYSSTIFGLSRIIISSEEETNKLKKDKRFDDVLAYHSYKKGLSSSKNMYPTVGGVGEWIKTIEKTLLKMGVTILKKAEIQKITTTQDKVNSIQINNKEYKLDKLIWTVPPFILLHKLNIENSIPPPKRLTSCIFHFLVNEKYLTDLYYFQCYDTDLKTFRVTLYDNYSTSKLNKYRVTVEVLLENPPKDQTALEKEIFGELITMNVFSKKAKLLESAIDVYPNGFPVLTKEFLSKSIEQCNRIKDQFSNIKIYGKSKNKTWFMNDIILETYHSINAKHI